MANSSTFDPHCFVPNIFNSKPLQPTVLIVTTTNWVPTARLAVGLASAGFTVEALCPAGHPIGQTQAARRTHSYHGLWPLRSLAGAIAAAKPDLVLPGDDLATRHLHELHGRPEMDSADVTGLRSLLEKSLGSPERFPVIHSRAAFMEVAREVGIRVPETATVETEEQVKDSVDRIGLPMVLKADGTSGGEGVRVARTASEAQLAFRKLQAPPLLARAFKRAVADHDRTLLRPSLLRRRPAISAQAFVAGHEATSTIVCWKGVVRASLHFEVLRKSHAAGHATVVRFIDHPEIPAAVEKIVRRIGLSGFCGFDFMLEAATGNAYLIEINPRATQVGHLTLGAGRDLPAALYGAVTGQLARVAPAMTDNPTIALFPHEWARDPQSEFLRTGYHDVPWGTPELLRACIRRSQKQSAWYARNEQQDEVPAATLSPSSSSASSSAPSSALKAPAGNKTAAGIAAR